jgi:predicted metal-dependent hydrolase
VPGLVLVLEDDLLFAWRVETGLRANGYGARFVTQFSELGEALKAAPVLILVNTGSRGVPWMRMVELAKARRVLPHASIVGYGPHVDLELRQRALEAGCDAVVGRSAIAGKLDSLLQRYVWKPDPSVCDLPLPDSVQKGLRQFNNGAFYRCHDSIEEVWVAEPGDVRLMYQGLLQIGVAFHHVQKGNWRGAVKMLARGKGKLLPFLPACQGVDLVALLREVEAAEVDLHELSPEKIADFDCFPTVAVAC